MSYNKSKEICPILPKDERTFKSNLHNDKFYIYKIIKYMEEKLPDEFETDPWLSNLLNELINLCEKDLNIDLHTLKNEELPNYKKMVKVNRYIYNK